MEDAEEDELLDSLDELLSIEEELVEKLEEELSIDEELVEELENVKSSTADNFCIILVG